jgi:hypothetical protein
MNCLMLDRDARGSEEVGVGGRDMELHLDGISALVVRFTGKE